jgi:hypothetical protein
MIESTSKLDSLRVLSDSGVAGVLRLSALYVEADIADEVLVGRPAHEPLVLARLQISTSTDPVRARCSSARR